MFYFIYFFYCKFFTVLYNSFFIFPVSCVRLYLYFVYDDIINNNKSSNNSKMYKVSYRNQIVYQHSCCKNYGTTHRPLEKGAW